MGRADHRQLRQHVLDPAAEVAELPALQQRRELDQLCQQVRERQVEVRRVPRAAPDQREGGVLDRAEVPVGEAAALRQARGARGVDDRRVRPGRDGRRAREEFGLRGLRQGRQCVHPHHRPQRGKFGPQRLDPLRLRRVVADHDHRLGVRQHPGELLLPRRRIHGDEDRARRQHPEVGVRPLRPGLRQYGHPLARGHPHPEQRPPDGPYLRAQFPVRAGLPAAVSRRPEPEGDLRPVPLLGPLGELRQRARPAVDVHRMPSPGVGDPRR